MECPSKSIDLERERESESGHFHSLQTTGTVLCAIYTSTVYKIIYSISVIAPLYSHTSFHARSTRYIPSRLPIPMRNPRAPLLLFPATLPKHAPPTGCGSRPRDLTTEAPLLATRRIRRVLVSSIQQIRGSGVVTW